MFDEFSNRPLSLRREHRATNRRYASCRCCGMALLEYERQHGASTMATIGVLPLPLLLLILALLLVLVPAPLHAAAML